MPLQFPWFHGKLPRDETEFLLSQVGGQDGLFLARQSSTEKEKIVISVCQQAM